jgi:excisionase family DNA binding protein
MITPPGSLLSLPEAARRLDVHPRTVRRYITTGRLRGYRLGPRLLKVELTEVLSLLQPVGADEQSA